MSQRLPSIPLRLTVICYVCDAPWLVDRHTGDWRFTPSSAQYWEDNADAGEYLSALMNVRNVEGVQPFLSRYGTPFRSLPPETPPVKPTSETPRVKRKIAYNLRRSTYWERPHTRSYFYWRELIGLQRALQELAQSNDSKLLYKLSGLSVQLLVLDGHLVADCHRANGGTACFAQLCFEKLQGTTFGWCERTDCGRFFRHTNRHAKKYCNGDCAHIVAVRNSRKRKES